MDLIEHGGEALPSALRYASPASPSQSAPVAARNPWAVTSASWAVELRERSTAPNAAGSARNSILAHRLGKMLSEYVPPCGS